MDSLRSLKNTCTSFRLYFPHCIIFLKVKKETKVLSYNSVTPQLYQNTAIFTFPPQISQLKKNCFLSHLLKGRPLPLENQHGGQCLRFSKFQTDPTAILLSVQPAPCPRCPVSFNDVILLVT